MAIPDEAKPYARGYEHFGGMAEEVSSKSRPAWNPPSAARPGAPNVILMVMDDMGFSDIGPFGSEIRTPHLDALAADGYRFTNYHTNPLCSPARASLLTGLNSHRAGYASVVHFDPGYPAYRFLIADDVPTIAESFLAGGYATFMVGKWHLTKESLMHDAAARASWPLAHGFERYYGSMDGFTTLFEPHRLVRDNSPLVIDEYPADYYFTDALTDEALAMIKALRASDPHKPFFLYFAHQAVHAPLQAKATDIAKYRGAYECGWDHIRDERFRRQIDRGLFPAGTQPAPRNAEPGAEVAAWESLSDEQRLLFARYMEVYAAAIDNVDQNLGHLIDHLKVMGEYDNTLIAFTSDNGGSGEGGPEGTRSYFSQFIHEVDLSPRWQRDVPRDPDLIGGPRAFVHYPRGWAYASNTPFRFYKGYTFEGGVHAPLLVSWPRGLARSRDDEGIRRQFTCVADLGLTLLELAGVKHLTRRGGRPAQEVDGVAFARLFADRECATLHGSQYSECHGQRGLYDRRWKIVTLHAPGKPYSDAEWQLYDLERDPTELHDVAAEHPEVVRDLARRWREAAWRNTVFPLIDDGSLNVRPSSELAFEQPVTLYPGTPTLERFRSSKLIRLRDVVIEARFGYRTSDIGVLVAHGDQGGGYVLCVEDGAVTFAYNEYGAMSRLSVPLFAAGNHVARLSFACGSDLDWRIALSVEGGEPVALEAMRQLLGMSPFTGISVGVDRGSPVDWDLYTRRGAFRYSGSALTVRYLPGPKASYNPEIIRQIEAQVAQVYD
ncbi:MAG TPA: sulfatase-like hydrolase/transferase [Nevskiaceae bacterium]